MLLLRISDESRLFWTCRASTISDLQKSITTSWDSCRLQQLEVGGQSRCNEVNCWGWSIQPPSFNPPFPKHTFSLSSTFQLVLYLSYLHNILALSKSVDGCCTVDGMGLRVGWWGIWILYKSGSVSWSNDLLSFRLGAHWRFYRCLMMVDCSLFTADCSFCRFYRWLLMVQCTFSSDGLLWGRPQLPCVRSHHGSIALNIFQNVFCFRMFLKTPQG